MKKTLDFKTFLNEKKKEDQLLIDFKKVVQTIKSIENKPDKFPISRKLKVASNLIDNFNKKYKPSVDVEDRVQILRKELNRVAKEMGVTRQYPKWND